jgi:hypothetical protein
MADWRTTTSSTGTAGSLVDNKGNFVDDGHYIFPNDHTIVLFGPKNGLTAHFRFSDDLNTVKFDLVLPKNLDECSESCRQDYAYGVSVFFSGLPWHRVCQGDHKDNNVKVARTNSASGAGLIL